MSKTKDTIRSFLGGQRPVKQVGDIPTEEQNQVDPSAYYPFDSQLEMSRVAPGMYRPIPERVILEWLAPSRPFRKRNKQFFTTVLVIALLISLILFFSGQFLPIAMVFSVVFLNYVLAVIPPQDITHKITNFGVSVEGKLYAWQELGRFWFDKKYDSLLLMIETAYFPGRLTLVLPPEKKQEVIDILSEVLLHQKPPLSTFEKLAQWVQEKFPLE
ncbi:MAG: hypothetical protein ACOZAK_03290 [Patescibacteria group bacterium]